jgi:hypothetical protein
MSAIMLTATLMPMAAGVNVKCSQHGRVKAITNDDFQDAYNEDLNLVLSDNPCPACERAKMSPQERMRETKSKLIKRGTPLKKIMLKRFS